MIPAEIAGLRFTAIERQIMMILSDGHAHDPADLLIWDKMADEVCLDTHIYNLRRKLDGSRYRIYRGIDGSKSAYRLTVLMSLPASA